MNLLINAKQAMPFGGQINISVDNFSHDGKRFINLPKGEYLKIRIEDQGVGISKNNLSKIFDPFFTTKQEGHGLGLSSVHYIITKHGGYITVDSEIDVGTKFEILLPASEKKLIEQNTRDIQPEQGSSDKVLFMDDDDMIRENIIEFGDLLNYKIEGAENGEKAIELYKQAIADGSPYKAVILDLTVKGGMGGEETLIELKKIDPNVKAIVFSGHSTKPIVANYREYGFIGKLEKPASISSVAKVLEEALIS